MMDCYLERRIGELRSVQWEADSDRFSGEHCLDVGCILRRTDALSTCPTQGFIPRELIANEVNWFYTHLGIDDTYFQAESVEVISDHIIALFGAKVLAYTKHDPSKLVIDLEKIDENGNGATFIHTSSPGKTTTEGPGATCESRIDELFLDISTPEHDQMQKKAMWILMEMIPMYLKSNKAIRKGETAGYQW